MMKLLSKMRRSRQTVQHRIREMIAVQAEKPAGIQIRLMDQDATGEYTRRTPPGNDSFDAKAPDAQNPIRQHFRRRVVLPDHRNISGKNGKKSR
jgi:hypothetical protein